MALVVLMKTGVLETTASMIVSAPTVCSLELAWIRLHQRNIYLITLVKTATRHFETELAIVDVDSLECPSPIPSGVDTDLCVIDGNVAHGELLIANPDTELATIENEVTHEATASVLHEYT
jgi:hypothetical protein